MPSAHEVMEMSTVENDAPKTFQSSLWERAALRAGVVGRCVKGIMIWQTDVLLGFLMPMWFIIFFTYSI